MSQKFLNGVLVEGGDLSLSGGNIYNTSGTLIIQNNAGAMVDIKSNQGIRFYIDKNNDDTSRLFEILANTDAYDANNVVATVSQLGNATFAGSVTTSSILAASNFTLDVGGNITLDADSGSILLKDGGTQYLTFTKSGNDAHIVVNRQDGDIKFFGNDGGSSITALTLDMSEGGNATFAGTVTANGTVLTGDQTLPTDFVSKANGGTFDGNIAVQDISMGSTNKFTHGSYLELSYGASNTSQFTFNADYDGAQTGTYTPHYSGTTSSGMSIVKMPSGGVGGLDFYVKQHGTTSGSHNISTFTKILELNQNGTSTFGGNIVMAANATVDGVDISGLPTSFAPTNAEANVQADWNATSGDALILNKPAIPTDFVSAANGGTFSGPVSISDSAGAAWLSTMTNSANNGHGLLIQAGGTTGTRYITQWKDAAGTERFHMDDTGEAYFQNSITASNFSGSSSGTNTGDQTLPTDFVSAANGGTFSGNVNIGGDLTVDGSSIGLYHQSEEDKIYFDDYNGAKFLHAVFNKNQRADIIRYQPVDNLEYWNGSSWQDGSSQLANLKNLLDGRQDTNWYLPSTYYKIRFTVTASTSYPLRAHIGLQMSWTGSSFPGCSMQVEEKQTDNSWLEKVDAQFTSTNGVNNWGTMFRADSALHTGRGATGQGTRITIDFYGWTPSNSSYVTVPLQNIFIFSNFSGSENTDYSNLLDYDKNLSVAGNINLGSGKTVDGVDISALPTSFAPTNAEANVQADWNATSGDAHILNKPTIPTDFVSKASGGTFAGDVDFNSDVTINGITSGGAVTSRTLNFTTNPTNAGLSGANEYLIGEVAFTGKDSSTNAAGKYIRIKGSATDGNTTVQGSGGEGGKLVFTLLRHDVGAQPRVEYDVLTLQPSSAILAGDVTINSAGTAASPILRLNNSSSSTFNHALEAINDNLTAGETELLLFGKETNSRNSGFIGFNWNADDDNSNYVTIGHWGYNHLVKIFPTGNTTFAGTITASGYNNSNWDTAYTHSQAAHAPSNAEQNVQSDWNATSGDAFIQNKPSTFAPSAHNQAWSTITSTPTTLSGYGITDIKPAYINHGVQGDHDMHTWDKVHAVYSDASGSNTYWIITTNVPQDNYSMGGFELIFEDDYSGDQEGGTIKIYGYWNPESNGGFTGFKYTTDNPNLSSGLTIQVGRNSSGKTCFAISGHNQNYAQIIAKNLWLGYNASSANSTWGDSWSIATSASTGLTNLNTLTKVPDARWDNIQGLPSTFAPSAHNQAWSTITSTPTTIAGYGITDAFDGAYSSLTGTPTIPTDHGDHDGLYIPVGGGQFSGALDFTPDTGAILKVDNQTIIERTTANGGLTIGHDDSIILAGGDTSSTMNSNITNSSETVFIGAEGGLKVYAFPNNMSGGWAARKEWTFDNGGVTTFPGNITIGAHKYTLTVNAPTGLTTTIVNSTINVTFTESTTTNIDNYLVFSSVDGGDYGLISVIPPADFGATMSIIDDSFDATGTQAYRVYAVKNGIYSSALTGNKSYSVTTPLEPTNMSVVNLNKAYYVQWDPPSANTRFVTAYNVYKHEHATQASLLRSSATLIYSGLNTSYMYQISGANNTNFHQFWVETTIA